VRILAASDEGLRTKIEEFQLSLVRLVEEKNAALRASVD
jgi:phosphoribosylcarboxyaminoimidazole (NCAIR) mutase